MQFTISGMTVLAVITWTVGACLMAVAAFDGWQPGWIGIAPMMLGNAVYMRGRLRSEANRLAIREDVAFKFGKEAALRSVR